MKASAAWDQRFVCVLASSVMKMLFQELATTLSPVYSTKQRCCWWQVKMVNKWIGSCGKILESY